MHLLLTNQSPTSFKRKHQAKRIPNYQLYAVEKWLLQRRHTTLLVVYTGNPDHLITLDAYEPENQQVWDETIAVLRADGARPRQTPDGVLMVTSLAHFRSDYTIVQIPGGDFNQVKDQLYANINLLRIGCSGRTALTLEDPSESTKERFISLYSLPDPAPPTSVDHLPLPAQSRPSLNFNNSTSSLPSRSARSRESFVTTVLELVKLIQVGLALFGMPNMTVVPPNLVFDGLLCDDTVQGIQLWTSHIGGPCVGLEVRFHCLLLCASKLNQPAANQTDSRPVIRLSSPKSRSFYPEQTCLSGLQSSPSARSFPLPLRIFPRNLLVPTIYR